MSSRIRWLLVAVSLVGVCLSLAATRVHYRLLTDASYVSPCDINATFNCSTAYLSRYGSIAGVPVALGGVLWFGVVAVLAGFAQPSRGASVAATYMFGLVLVGVPVVAFLGYMSYVRLHVGCPICMGTYACVLAILLLTSMTEGVPLRTMPGRLVSDLRDLTRRVGPLVLLLLLMGGVSVAAMRFPREGEAATAAPPPPSDVQAAFAAAWAQQPRIDLGIPADGAKVLIVKFNDFECSTCRVAESYYAPVLQRFAQSNPGAVRVVFKDWPWNTACNAGVPTIPGHEASCAAAAAARMARARGQYDAMAAWLFANQDTTPAAVQDQVKQQLGITAFDAEYARVLPDIQRDITDGRALQIHSTPTYFINGVRIPSEQLIGAEYFDLAIQLELKRAG
jgi:uncharacterized membrane protein/protein-disulfide isomerase